MPQQEIEIILARQLASYLAVPIFLVDPQGTLLFYNEPAESILGRRFEESGPMSLDEWATVFEPSDESGAPLPPAELPLVTALNQGRPAHKSFRIRGLDGGRRSIEVTSYPLVGQAGRQLGALAVFWEED
ncbi:MAG TPA: PAS domain-containing protein [Gemmatimonadota bacterium]|nr:PAS domain-containing protein [Gemmatimonadota bacterium]